MARLIDADALGIGKANPDVFEKPEYAHGWNSAIDIIQNAPTVDAVEADDMKEFAEDVAYQFGYYCQNGGRLHITHGGLSTLEWAFGILGWKNPHPVPECECEIEGCHEHATCGAPTNDGYKRMCGKHCRERSIDNAWCERKAGGDAEGHKSKRCLASLGIRRIRRPSDRQRRDHPAVDSGDGEVAGAV